jgi:hypothetical protein
MNSTGYKCPQSCIWATVCHREEIALSKGDTFPPCPGCSKGATWRLIRPTR